MHFYTLHTSQLDQIPMLSSTINSSLFEFQKFHSIQTCV